MFDQPTNDDEADREAALSKRVKASYEAIDDAIRAHLVANEITGISTGWVLLIAISDIDEDGDDLDGLFDLHSDGLTKWAKVGLLSVALDQQRVDGFY